MFTLSQYFPHLFDHQNVFNIVPIMKRVLKKSVIKWLSFENSRDTVYFIFTKCHNPKPSTWWVHPLNYLWNEVRIFTQI